MKLHLGHTLLLPLALLSCIAWAQPDNPQISIDAKAPSTPFPHFWEEMFGSGRAVL